MSQPFDQNQYFRADQRSRYSQGTAALKKLQIALGYDEHVHQLMNAEKFHAVTNLYPSEYLDIVRYAFSDVSSVAVDHSQAEVLAVICIVTDEAIRQLTILQEGCEKPPDSSGG